jgi:protein-L-isoaspartate(D-aspartate) O-methyltransferase
MLSVQLRARGIVDERVLAAMAAVPRERFVPAGSRDLAYSDQALRIGAGQTISQPLMVALMTQLLDPPPGCRVLEIGTGSGYQAAVLAAMGCDVLGIERLPELADAARERIEALGFADRVEIRVGDGSLGSPADA